MVNGDNHRIAIVGLGLIGASLALSLRGKYHIIGCERDESVVRIAEQNGVADEILAVSQLQDVACVIVCTPLGVLRDTVREVYEAVGDSAIITDVGSVKGVLCGMKGRIVGGHPMAGTEHSGIRAAKPHLFENAYYCVVPYENSLPADVEYVEDMTRQLKAIPVRLSWQEHDKAVADFSHCPHLAAYALSSVAISDGAAIAGSGFMDCTRIACSDPVFWTQVLSMNRDNVLASLNAYIGELNAMRSELSDCDYAALAARLKVAQDKRKSLTLTRAFDSDYMLSVDVRDEVGSIGAVASLLIQNGVNISNIQILNSREGVGGALMLSLTTRRDAERARAALTGAGYTLS